MSRALELKATRHFSFLSLILFLLIFSGLALVVLTRPEDKKIRYHPLQWTHLTGWSSHDFGLGYEAYVRSCAVLKNKEDVQNLSIGPYKLIAEDWKKACQLVLEAHDFQQALENHYIPVAIQKGGRMNGHFTGYYVPLLKGSTSYSPEYPIPLYRRPGDLVDVNLGLFRADLKGKRISGRLNGRRLVPHADRAEIEAGALEGQGLELLWVSSAADAFFLHIQGSGYVEMEDGRLLKVGYDGQNGHPYYAIGRSLVSAGEVAQEDMSLQAIAAWMMDNPDRAEALMQENRSFIFFRLLEGDGVLGAQGVELTPERSLAVDWRLVPYGAPLWIETDLPDGVPFHQFMMAQDTGGAIRGPGRGDIFFGMGADALELAGPMNAKGRMVVFIPKAVLDR